MKHQVVIVSLLLALTTLFSACVVPVAPAAPAGEAAAVAEPVAEGDRTDWRITFHVGFFAGDDAEKTLKDNEPFRLIWKSSWASRSNFSPAPATAP